VVSVTINEDFLVVFVCLQVILTGFSLCYAGVTFFQVIFVKL